MDPVPAPSAPRLFDRLAAIVESSDDAIISKTPQGTITSWNCAATRIFGYDSAEAIGRHITMLFPRERLVEEEEFMTRIARGERVEHFETERVRKDGTRVAVSITLSPVKDQQGRIVEISHIARDISERRSLEQALRHREKLATLATLSAGIAHELNNPLGTISTRIQLMRQHTASQPLPDQVIEDLQVLSRNIQRVTRIAKQLLSFARQAPEEPKPFDVNAVIDETLQFLLRPLANDGLRIKTNLDRTLGPILGHADALQQVLTNLLLNARDAMPRGGDVLIETASERDRVDWLRLTVSDAGDGMYPEAVDRIWELFYTTKSSGTGLGLSVVQKIIREHGGTIEVQSALGNGTTFTIDLPMHRARS